MLLLGEILYLINDSVLVKLNRPKITAIVLYIQKILTSSLVSKVLAFLGFIAISITGLLGGAMVYSSSADPMTGIVLHLLGIN